MPDNCSHSSERRCAARASVLIFSGKLTPLLLGLQCLLELPPRHQIVWHAIFRSLPQRKRAGNCSQATANLLAPPKKEPQEVSFENSVITPLALEVAGSFLAKGIRLLVPPSTALLGVPSK